MRKYVFREYKKGYPKLFLKEKEKLERFLPKNINIEHIGSTAVPGLGGKGILDIMVGFKTNHEMKEYTKLMLKKRYEIMPGFKRFGRISFKKFYGLIFWKRRIHVHFVLLNKRIWVRNINFRNKLRKSSKLLNEYTKIKKEAVKYAKGEGKKYRDYKDNFIKKMSTCN